MKMPQEIEVWYVLPAVRLEIAKGLKKKGLNQQEISKKMHVTPAAISNYFKNKRATGMKFNEKVMTKINNAVENISKGNCFVKEVQEVLKVVRKTESLCEVHKKYSQTPEKCGACLQ